MYYLECNTFTKSHHVLQLLEIPWDQKKRKLSDTPDIGPDFNIAPTCGQGTPSSFSQRKPYDLNCPSSPGETSTLVFSEKGRSKYHTQGPILKKSKEQPVEFSQWQVVVSHSETILAPFKQWKKKLLQQHYDNEKFYMNHFMGKVANNGR